MRVCWCFKIFGGAVLASTLAACGHPEQKFAVTVTDESGKPLSGIECKAWFKKPGKESAIQDYFVTGATDANGKVELTGETLWAPTSVEARKSGYYLSLAGKHWTERRNGNRWEPWPVELKLVMKKIRNPHPMYVVQFDGQKWLNFPDKKLGPFGFDLMAGDWVSPYGEGTTADFILEGIKDQPEDEAMNPKGKVLLSFSHDGDGILSLDDPGHSVLIGPGVAPEEGYQSQWEFVNWKPHPTESKLMSQDFSGEVFLFRVRTKLDKEGNVERAHYGKIDGRILGRMSLAAPRILMTYYFNGTANDRSLEWDGETNLIPDTSRMRVPERP